MELWPSKHVKMVCCSTPRAPSTITATTTGQSSAENVNLIVRRNFYSTLVQCCSPSIFFSYCNLNPRLWISIRNLWGKRWMLHQLHQVRIRSSTPTSMHKGFGLWWTNSRLQLARYVVGEMQPGSCRRFQVPIEGWSCFARSPFLAFPTFRCSRWPSQSLPLYRRPSTLHRLRRGKSFRREHFDLRGCWIENLPPTLIQPLTPPKVQSLLPLYPQSHL